MAQPGRKALFVFTNMLVVLLLISACAAPADNTSTPAAAGAASATPAAAQEEKSAVATATIAMPEAAPTQAASGDGAGATQGALETPTTPAAEIPVTQGTAEPTAAQAAGQQVPSDTVSSFPDPAGYIWAPVVSGLQRPVDIADLKDGRMLVLEQPGLIRVVQNNNLLPDPFLDIQDRVGSSGNEQGLLGIALHPQFSQNGFFYVNYTDKKGDTSISRFSVATNDPNRADPNSEKVLLKVDQPYANHNGGVMVFGPDGFLYLGLGDGGSAGDPKGNAQSLDTLLGKILRIDVNNGDPYANPADNPFANGGGKPEIWAYGLRNPWRFSFDRLTGDLYIADVGQNQWEEIDVLPAGTPGGQNLGWDYREGAHDYEGGPPAGTNLKLVEPVFEYSHSEGCSVTGGFVYRGQNLPEFRGVYLFADYCSGQMWGLLRGADGSYKSQLLFQTGMNITSFGQDGSGELYIADQKSGGIYRLQQK